MISVSRSHADQVGRTTFTIRRGLPSEIGTLCAIDADASTLFERAGIDLNLPAEHEFSVAERNRWLRCLIAGTSLLAVDPADAVIGFAAAETMDGRPYLDQLSVRASSTRLGVGAALLGAIEQLTIDAGETVLWLMTYDHLPWNRPFYERSGYAIVPEAACGPELLRELAYQRRWLPLPDRRVVMRKRLTAKT